MLILINLGRVFDENAGSMRVFIGSISIANTHENGTP